MRKYNIEEVQITYGAYLPEVEKSDTEDILTHLFHQFCKKIDNPCLHLVLWQAVAYL